MTMRFINQTTNQNLTIACRMADALLSSPTSKLYKTIKEKDDWKYGTNMSGAGVALMLYEGPSNVEVLTYRPWNPWTSAIAMTNGDGKIHFNIYKIQKLSTLDMVGTLLHEMAHMCGFGHGSNYKTKDKCLYSVPYYLSDNTARFV